MLRILAAIGVGACLASNRVIGQGRADDVPTADAIEQLLEREPLSEESWPTWLGGDLKPG